MQVRNPAFYQACIELGKEAYGFLCQAADKIPESVRLGFEVDRLSFPTGTLGVSFRETRSTMPDITPLVKQTHWNELLTLSSFRHAVEVMTRSPEIARHTNQYVGTKLGQHRIKPHNILIDLLINYWKNALTLSFREEAFDKVYQSLENFFYCQRFQTQILVPIDNFDCSVPEIDLDNDLRIKTFSNDALQRLYADNSWFRDLYKDRLLDIPQSMIIREREEEKLIGHFVPHDDAYKADIDGLISALRILKPGFVGYQLIQISEGPQEWGCFPSMDLQPRTSSSRSRYSITESDVNELKGLWRSYKSVRWDSHKSLKVAVNRLNLGRERESSEDRIIDYAISLEALFLGDVGSPEERGEMTFRLAFRGARFLADDPRMRKDIYDELRKIYKVRSRVVHGAHDVPPLDDSVNKAEDYIQRALKKFIELAKCGKTGPLIDWDDVLLN